MIPNYVISSTAFSLILFWNLTSLKSIIAWLMKWIHIQAFPFSVHSKITQSLRITKVKSLIRHFFFFENTYTDVVKKAINNLNVAKISQVNGIFTNFSKINKDVFASFITDHFNYSISYGEFNLLPKYLDSLLATNQFRFQTGFSSQNCLLLMMEKFKEAIDKRNQLGALIVDLLKAFDCIHHKLLIAKLYECHVSSSKYNFFLPES